MNNIMKIKDAVGGIVLFLLDNYDPLKKNGINQVEIFEKVKGYDEKILCKYHSNFKTQRLSRCGKTKYVNASILIPWFFGIYSTLAQSK